MKRVFAAQPIVRFGRLAVKPRESIAALSVNFTAPLRARKSNYENNKNKTIKQQAITISFLMIDK